MKKNQDFLINLSKIIIIGFVSFSLIANAIPFYLGYDDVNYGIGSINLSQGHYEITNDLLEETSNFNFLPRSYVQTNTDSAIPKSAPGIYPIGAISYLIGGFYGLFYLGSIFTIILLIIFERVTTKFFGNLVSLLALLFLVADWQFFFVGLRLLTDNIFSLFFILGVFSLITLYHKPDDYRFILFSSTFFTIATFFRINGIIFLPLESLIVFGLYLIPYIKEKKILYKKNLGIVLDFRILIKNNYKKFIKISFFLLIPWIFFLIFWFGYNDYFFGDYTTNYKEQLRTATIDEEIIVKNGTEISKSSEVVNEFERIKLVQYFSVPLLPDPIYFFLVISSDTDLDLWRSDVWISYITFSLMTIGLTISFYFKIKRKEILTLILFILALVAFFSSPLGAPNPLAPHLSESANHRYMLPASMLSFVLIGFILVESWTSLFSRFSIKGKKIMKYLKFTYLILIIIFFLALIIVLPSIQDFYQTGFIFNNPSQYSNNFEKLEKLPDKSLIIGLNGRETLLHTDTHFYPYGQNFLQDKNPEMIPKSKIDIINKTLNEGYSLYAFKNNMPLSDSIYFKFLETEHGIVLKNYSPTFCKLEFIDTQQENDMKNYSDPICFKDVNEGKKKIWSVTLKWPK